MQTRKRAEFTTIRTEGAILPPDLLERVREGESDLEGMRPDDYRLEANEKLNERISRSWSRLVGAWASFQSHITDIPDNEPGTTETRERWLLPLFRELDFGRLRTAKAYKLNGKSYPISHGYEKVPIHLVGARVALDRRRAGVAGAARASPHSLVQELLNRSDDHLWAFLSNGLRLRILRDNASLTRQAYVEFDLEAMMEGEVYADFALLWLLCHQSRVEGEIPEEFWLERWSLMAQEQGTRALEQLREGVEEAIRIFGEGFLAHPGNYTLKERLREGDLDPQEYYRQLLRMVYRLIFLFVAEDRGLLFNPASKTAARERYREHYSTARLRRLAERRRGTRHPDLYRGLWVVMEKLGSDAGCPELGLPGLGGFLWSEQAVADLAECQLANHDLLYVVRSLAFTEEGRVRRAVDYKNLGPEELGSVYESLLELQPEMNVDAPTFDLKVVGGSERKTTGSYYTPTSLIQCLLDSALDPVIEEALKEDDPEEALLNLKICDPATGSGHFLVSAAHRVARSLAAVRTGDAEPSPEAQRTALREVIGRCLYGVDINPDAVELCKVNLWLEAIDPGKPLTFLDDQILCGNSLLGTTPALMEKGIPDEAFKPIEGDDKKFASSLKKQNKRERPKEDLLEQGIESAQSSMFAEFEREERFNYALLQKVAIGIAETDDSSVSVVREKGEKYRALLESEAYQHSKLIADAWCSAFVWHKTTDAPEPITEASYRKLASNPKSISVRTKNEIERLSEQYQFFHWHLAFAGVVWLAAGGYAPEPEVTGWSGGFSVVLGNPPWERIKLQEKEWFAGRDDEIVKARNKNERMRLIRNLQEEDPSLYSAFLSAKRVAEGQSHLIRVSGKYPLCGRGDFNTYAIFSECFRLILAAIGRAGIIVPSGIATEQTTKLFFIDLMKSFKLISLFDFQNTMSLFPAVDRNQKFSLLTMSGIELNFIQPRFSFAIEDPIELSRKGRGYSLTNEDMLLLNPNTGTCPTFRTERDAKIILDIYSRTPILIREVQKIDNLWGIDFFTMFHMSGASNLFRGREYMEREGMASDGNLYVKGNEVYLPLYEGKMIWQYDHRYSQVVHSSAGQRLRGSSERASETDHLNPGFYPLPRYWVSEKHTNPEVQERGWVLGFRRVAGSVSNIRTAVFVILPSAAVSDSIFLINCDNAEIACLLLGNFNCFALDYILRNKISGINLSFYFIKQLPIIPPVNYSAEMRNFVLSRVLELSYTAWDLYRFGMDLGYDGPPFRWDEYRRFLLHCELDAAFFHLYLPATPDRRWRPARIAEGAMRDESDEELAELEKHFPMPRHAVDYILDTFPIVRRRDEAEYGEYRTKRVILEIYDDMQRAIATGEPYQTRLDPPPADPRVAHPARE